MSALCPNQCYKEMRFYGIALYLELVRLSSTCSAMGTSYKIENLHKAGVAIILSRK